MLKLMRPVWPLVLFRARSPCRCEGVGWRCKHPGGCFRLLGAFVGVLRIRSPLFGVYIKGIRTLLFRVYIKALIFPKLPGG